MNNHLVVEPRAREKTLILVEGHHEKNELFRALFKCFPETNTNEQDIWIYGTNIYSLYDSLVHEYGTDWYEFDVDLPLLISRERSDLSVRNKNSFKNIILVFDYERHDPKFSVQKIETLQTYFCDATDMGKLYINYPMIESYQDMRSIPDHSFNALKIPVTLHPGAAYKATVRDSLFDQALELPNKIRNFLVERCSCQVSMVDQVVDQLLKLQCDENLREAVSEVLSNHLAPKYLSSSKYYITHLIQSLKHILSGHSYWQYLRFCFQHAMKLNLCKCSSIIGGNANLSDEECRMFIQTLEFRDVLSRQNILSSNPLSGEIWVLNTCILLIPEYRYDLIKIEA